jgi:hypothetical protein
MALPYVPTRPLSLIALPGTGIEPVAIRNIAEWFWFHLDTHWIGSREQFTRILTGEIPTQPLVILSCHGDEGGILMDPEPPLLPQEIREIARLTGKTILSLGCETGTPELAQAFRDAGCQAYIAPTQPVDGSASLLFAVHLLYHLANGTTLEQAFAKSAGYDDESRFFRLY